MNRHEKRLARALGTPVLTRSSNIADRFLTVFGPAAFSSPERGMAALKWLAETDPNGTGHAIPDGIAYHFSDGSTLVFDRSTNHFTRPQ
jgi:hypothetical protein